MRTTPFLLAAASLALAAAVTAPAQAQGRPGGMGGDMTRAAFTEHAGKMFARMDVNGDGKLDAADRAAVEAKRFAKADADGNGEVSKAEMQAAHAERKAKMEQRRAEREAKAGEMLDRRFAMLDKDGSGGLSQAEMAAGREARGEMRGQRKGPGGEAREGRRGPRAEGGEEPRGPRAEGGEARGKRGGKRGGMEMMRGLVRQADANQDRVVTRAEFDAAIAAHFNKMDADGNGTVTADERQAARAAMKQMRGERRGGGQ